MNQLKMEHRQAIITLSINGWSQRRIARELGIDRETVARYRRQTRQEAESKPAISPAGSVAPQEPKPAISPAGLVVPEQPKPAHAPAGSGPGRKSGCEALREPITAGWQAGLSAQRIYQDLCTAGSYAGSYDAVKRFVRRLGARKALPFRRLECEAGQEAQVDFGQGAWVYAEGRRRRPHVLRVVLSHSRKGYSEALWQQTSENFIRALENAFRHFGGVPRTLVIDNLRAAVKKADWFEPELNPKVLSFCEHYGTVILPTRPAMPRHKGKVEAGVKYVQNNALAGRQFESLGAQNLFLAQWEETVADTRIHGTTRRQVRSMFLEVEKPALLTLPPALFAVFSEAPRKVHRDGHVEVARAYYSVPPEYVARQVWARWDTKLVRILNERREVIAVHVRAEAGRFASDPAHVHVHKRCLIERGGDWILRRCHQLGESAGAWAQKLYKDRGTLSLRVLQGLLALAGKHPASRLDEACRLALTHGSSQLRDLRALLARPGAGEQLEFIQSHPLIRDLGAYQILVPVCFPQPEPEPEPAPIHEPSAS
jgi:transposase